MPGVTGGGVTVSTETFRRLGLPADPSIFLAAARPGVSPETLKADVRAALKAKGRKAGGTIRAAWQATFEQRRRRR